MSEPLQAGGLALAIFFALGALRARGSGLWPVTLLAPALRIGATALVLLALGGAAIERAGAPRPGSLIGIVDGQLSREDRARARAYLHEAARAAPVRPAVTMIDAPGKGPGWLAVALHAALDELPARGERRIVVFSPGRRIASSDLRALHLARQLGIPVSAVAKGFAPRNEVRLTRLAVPPLVYEGDTVPVQVWAKNLGDETVSADLVIAEDGHPVARREVTLEPGTTVLEMPYRPAGADSHVIAVHLEGGGPGAGTSEALTAPLAMAGKLRVLVVSPDRHTLLGQALRLRGVEAEFRTPAGLPRTLAELLDFRCLVLSGIRAATVSTREVALWREYVRTFGGSIVVLGGRETFRAGRSPLADFLPLAPLAGPPPRPRPDRIALELVIDRSNSMGDNSLNPELRDGQKLRFAKAATLAVVDQLRDDDLVGVLAFDSKSHVVTPLAPLHRARELIRDRVARLLYGGSTDFHGSLELAYRELRAAAPQRRHIILLTDGADLRPHDYGPLLAHLRAEGITVTTIRIGTDEADLALLERIAAETGGAFHHIADAVMLPQVVLRDTAASKLRPGRKRRGQPHEERPQFFLHPLRDHPFLRGIDPHDLPSVPRFAMTRARRGARLVLEVDTGEHRYPLLAVRRLGLGRVVAIAAPVDRLEEWARWGSAAKFWSQLVRSVMRTREPVARTSGELSPRGAELLVELGEAGVERVVADVLLPDGSHRSARLEPIGARRYRAVLPRLPAGAYPVHLALERRGSKVELSQRVRFDAPAVAGKEPANPEQALRDIVAGGGGRLNPSASSLLRSPRKPTHRVPLDPLLVPLAALLVLAETAVREVSWPER